MQRIRPSYAHLIPGRVSETCVALAFALMVIAGCTSNAALKSRPTVHPPTSVTAAPSSPTAAGGASAPPHGHVFVIVMENKSAAEARAQPFTAMMAREYGVLTNYDAITHPSAPNYLALTSGSTWGRHDDGYAVLPPDDVGHQLTAAARTWRAYMEDLPPDCRQDSNLYAVKHDPFAYFGGSCPPQVVPLADLTADLAGTTPSFVWITPNLCNDGHDCSASTADGWLSHEVPAILASPAWQSGGALFVTWDEDDGSGANQVATLIISPTLRPTQPNQSYSHYSLLATIEDRLGLPRLAAVASTPAITLCC